MSTSFLDSPTSPVGQKLPPSTSHISQPPPPQRSSNLRPQTLQQRPPPNSNDGSSDIAVNEDLFPRCSPKVESKPFAAKADGARVKKKVKKKVKVVNNSNNTSVENNSEVKQQNNTQQQDQPSAAPKKKLKKKVKKVAKNSNSDNVKVENIIDFSNSEVIPLNPIPVVLDSSRTLTAALAASTILSPTSAVASAAPAISVPSHNPLPSSTVQQLATTKIEAINDDVRANNDGDNVEEDQLENSQQQNSSRGGGSESRIELAGRTFKKPETRSGCRKTNIL